MHTIHFGHGLLCEHGDVAPGKEFLDVLTEADVEGSEEVLSGLDEDDVAPVGEVRVPTADVVGQEVVQLAGELDGGRPAANNQKSQQPFPEK